MHWFGPKWPLFILVLTHSSYGTWLLALFSDFYRMELAVSSMSCLEKCVSGVKAWCFFPISLSAPSSFFFLHFSLLSTAPSPSFPSPLPSPQTAVLPTLYPSSPLLPPFIFLLTLTSSTLPCCVTDFPGEAWTNVNSPQIGSQRQSEV